MKDTIKQHISLILKSVDTKLSLIRTNLNWDSFSEKLKSELISNSIETAFEEIVPNTSSAKSDHKADIYINEDPLEIKTTKTKYMWRGGTFSKRESNYLLVSWDWNDNTIKWFCSFVHLKESDWKESTSNNYYATTLDLNDILDKDSFEIIWGSIDKKRTKYHCCKVGV